MILNCRIARQSALFTALLGGGFPIVGNAAPTEAVTTKTLDLTYDSVMDMVRPEVHSAIVVHHNLHVVVTDADVTEDRDRSYRASSDSDAMKQQLGGASGTYVSWSVAGPDKLVRTERDPQSSRTMTIDINADNTCHLDVTDELRPGFTEYKFSRIGTRTQGGSPTYAYFSSYRVTQTTCAMK